MVNDNFIDQNWACLKLHFVDYRDEKRLQFVQNCETKKVHLVFDFSMLLMIVSTFPYIQGSTVAHWYVI